MKHRVEIIRNVVIDFLELDMILYFSFLLYYFSASQNYQIDYIKIYVS